MSTTDVQKINLAQTPQMFQNGLAEFRAEIARAPYGVTVQDTVSQAAAIVITWRAGRAWVRANPMVSHAVINAACALLDESALQALTDLRRNFNQALTEYKRKLRDPDPEIAADEALRIWARVERQLVGGVSVSAVIGDADAATLRVIGEEIKSWRRAQMPDNVQGADYQAQGDMELITLRRYELATPEQRTRLDQAKAASQGEYRVNMSLGAAEHHIKFLADAEPGNTILPEWGPTELRV